MKYKLETNKLKQKLEKNEQKNKTNAHILCKLTEEIKAQQEVNRKQLLYINKLEGQLLKGPLPLDLIEGNKRLEDKIVVLERDLKALEALNQSLKGRLEGQDSNVSMLRSCLEINLNEFFEETGRKGSIDQLIEGFSNRNQLEEITALKKEIVSLGIINGNNQLEIASYQEALRQSFSEIQSLKKALNEKTACNIDHKAIMKENEVFLNENKALKIENEALLKENTVITKENTSILNEKKVFIKENERLEEELNSKDLLIKEYHDLISICEDVFTGDFEGILKESLSIILEKKTMKQKIHDIVEDCTAKLLGDE